MLLADRVCLITGGSRGIGLETARRFAGQGAKVILTGRSEEGVRMACAEVTSVGTGECHGLTCDVGDPKSVKSAFQQVHSQFRRLDVLVANAGILEGAYISMVTQDQIDRMFSTNTFGLLYCAQYAARLMARSGGGSIIT
ncbi:MAG: SDR family NAD(P)-dependent oxidoreductase, partial [Planctomycetaceae bacterium]